MLFDTPLPLIINSAVLALSMAFLIIVLSYDGRRTINQFFALFLIFVQVWNVGFLLSAITPTVDAALGFSNIAFGLSLLGYVGASITLYALMTILVGVQPRRFALLTSLYLMAGIGYSIILARESTTLENNLQARVFLFSFFAIFNSLTLYVSWYHRRKFTNIAVLLGVVLFVMGQGAIYLNADLGIVSASTTVSSIGALILSFVIIQRELIRPLQERGTQLEAMHEVSLAITSRIATDAVLTEIAERAANLLNGDAAAIFLKKTVGLQLVALHELPSQLLNTTIPIGVGVVGTVAQTKESIYLENYRRDWQGERDLLVAEETFGSIVCVPLLYDNYVIGVLMVIAGTQSYRFGKEDAELLEFIAAQAAVSITYGDLFNEQQSLTEQLAIANQQLSTVLISTGSPVLAVDRDFNLIFTNPAAETIFQLDTVHSRASVQQALPAKALPSDFREALKRIKLLGSYRYEITLNDKFFIVNVASITNGNRIDGFVAVMQDVTELKELDRIKSEMVRMTSHDLKNPLQAALANLDLLRDDIDDADLTEDSEISLSVNNIERQLNKMYRIIGGILDLERVRVGSRPIELCDPEYIVNDAIDELSDIAADQNIKLTVDITPNLPNFIGDTAQFKRAVINLIENAIKFSHAGDEVRVKVTQSQNEIIFIVRDDGIGIPKELHERIFDRFYRGHQRGAEHISGSGLGLSLVKAVVDSHKGQLRVESDEGRGTTFYIHIPALTAKTDNIEEKSPNAIP